MSESGRFIALPESVWEMADTLASLQGVDTSIYLARLVAEDLDRVKERNTPLFARVAKGLSNAIPQEAKTVLEVLKVIAQSKKQ